MADSSVLIGSGHAAIIRSEYDDGVVFQTELLKLGSDAAEALVHRLHHRGELRVILSLLDPPDSVPLMRFFGVLFS